MMIRCGGYILWLNIVWWYGLLQYIRPERVEYLVRRMNIICDKPLILYIDHWNELL